MGYVLKAEDTLLNNKIIAIKTLYTESYSDPDFIQNFKNEVSILQSLNHPNLVKVYDIFIEGNLFFYTMEHVDGDNLLDYVINNKLDLFNFTNLIIQLCKGLEAVHDNGLVHRDLKPENILIGKDGVVRIVDFGLAKNPSKGDTQSRNICGTTNYMSPEVCLGSPLSHKSDLYSLGIIIYELITLNTPFDDDNEHMIFHNHINKKQNSLKDEVKGVPVWISDLVDALLEKDPNLRPQSAREVIRAIRERIYSNQKLKEEKKFENKKTSNIYDSNIFVLRENSNLSYDDPRETIVQKNRS